MNPILKQLKLCVGSFRDFFATYVNQAGFKKLRERSCADSYSQSIWNGKCHADFWIKTFPCQMFAKFHWFTISENHRVTFCCDIMFHVTENKIIRYIKMVCMRQHWLIGNHVIFTSNTKNNLPSAAKKKV